MITLVLTVLVVVACVHIMLHNVFCINTMSKSTSYTVWLYHALLGVGAFWMLLQIANGHSPSIGASLLIIGISTKYLFERRRAKNPAGVRHGRV